MLALLSPVFGQNVPLPPIVNEYINEFRADFDVRDTARNDYRPLLANCVRLAFHYCVGDSGCDGCIDVNDPSNAGLELSVDYLDAKVDAWSQAGFSKADLYALASMVAANMALGGAGWESDLSNFEFGRTDCADQETEASDFPDSHQSPFQFFEDNFGFSARETTVILGAHTLGRALPGNSGFQNFWVENALDLGSAFYDAIARNPWAQIPIGNLFQWDQRPPRGGAPLMALNADMFLVRDLNPDANGRETRCARDFNQCESSATLPIVDSFRSPQGERQFQAEFKEVYIKMLRSAGQGLEQELELFCDVFDCENNAEVTPDPAEPVVPEVDEPTDTENDVSEESIDTENDVPEEPTDAQDDVQEVPTTTTTLNIPPPQGSPNMPPGRGIDSSGKKGRGRM